MIQLCARALLALALSASVACAVDFGPLFDTLTSPGVSARVRALGPVFEHASGTDGTELTAVRPLWSRLSSTDGLRESDHVLWPVYSRWRHARQAHWRFLFFLHTDFDVTDTATPRWRFWGLPFVFAGRDIHNTPYFALFPLGGRLHEFLGRDEIVFWLFPLYARSHVRDVHTTSVLWPIVSRTTGNGHDRFRVFPVYGWSKKPGSHKGFVLWPFYTHATYDEPRGGGWILFPVAGHIRLENQETWMFLPPLFRYYRSDKIEGASAPWPFLRWSRGEVDRLYIWPLWGRKRIDETRSGFFVWPVAGWESMPRGDGRVSRQWVLPVYFRQKTTQTREAAAFLRVWPLFDWQRDAAGVRRTRALALWPTRNLVGVDRNYRPFWTLYDERRADDRVDRDILWGLARTRRGADERRFSLFPLVSWERTTDTPRPCSWSLLLGLLGAEGVGESRHMRVAYVFRVPLRKAGRAEERRRVPDTHDHP